MANIIIDIPDRLITLYQTRKTTYDAYALPLGLTGLPPVTKTVIQRWVRDYIKGLLRRESWRLDDGVNNIAEQDETLIGGI